MSATTDEQNTITATVTPLTALRLAEENAAAGYLTARKAMLAAARRGTALIHLAAQHPTRADYRAAAAKARALFRDAEARTQTAYSLYVQAQHRSDAVWTVTEGRNPQLAAA